MNTFILAFSSQQSAISQMPEPNSPQRMRRTQKENGFTAENAEIAEKKWVPDSDQQGHLSSAPSAISAVNFLILCALCVLCG
jgi:hypothetical protein